MFVQLKITEYELRRHNMDTEERKVYMKEYRKRDYVQDKNTRNQRDYNRATRLKVLKIMGGKCLICGFSDVRALQVDHINGDGAKERLVLQNVSLMRWIVRNPEEAKTKYQLLCANHNWIKRFENREVRR